MSIFVFLWCFASEVQAQIDETIENEAQIVLENSPVASARAAGMGGALSTLADGIDAVYYNPAGIGGMFHGKKRPPFVRQFYFPYAGGSINANAQKTQKEISNSGGGSDAAAAAAAVNAQSGKRQYARVSLASGTVFGRVAIIPYHDQQVAALPNGDEDQTVNMRYRKTSGLATGLSIATPMESVFLGVSGGFVSRTETLGTFSIEEVTAPSTRNDAIGSKTKTYSGAPLNAGLVWRFAKWGTPALAIVGRDIGGTEYKANGGDAIKAEQDLTLGLSFSPRLGRNNGFNFLVEGNHLNNNDMAVSKKYKTAMEFLFGDRSSRAFLGLRGGYNKAGASYGASLTFGILSVQFGSQAVDIGKNNKIILERRAVGVVSVNVVDD